MNVRVDNNSSLKKHPKNLSHEVSSTLDFAFCTPVMVDEVEPNSSVNLRVGQVLRLNPMVSPTFGDIELKTYHNFVTIEDLFHAFPSLLGGRAYHGVGDSYVPQCMPSIPPSWLYSYLRFFGKFSVYEVLNVVAEYANQDIYSLKPVLEENPFAEDEDFQTAMSTYFQPFGFAAQDVYEAFNDDDGTCVYNYDIKPTGADWIITVKTGDKRWVVCGRFGQFSKNLMKVLIGCGYELNESNEEVSLMPLFAYYKTWFDLFMPNRTKTWQDTNAFHFMEILEQYGYGSFNDWFFSSPAAVSAFRSFIFDLTQCYYTDNVDFAAAHIDGNANAIAGNEEKYYVDYDGSLQSGAAMGENHEAAYIGISGALSAIGMRVVKALDKRLNTSSVIGGRLHTLLKSLYGINLDEHESSCFGTQQLSANIDDVMSTAVTSEGYLGEYAGQGLGKTPGKTFKFTSRGSFGYVVTIQCVAAHSRMCQGMDMQLKHLRKDDFYYEGYDSITLLPTNKKYIYASQDYGNWKQMWAQGLDGGFGNIPNSIEYKYKKNILNGDMRMMSTRDSYLPFTLDKLLPFSRVDFVDSELSPTITLRNLDLDFVVNGDQWRYQGKYPFFGQLDRIFVNAGNEYRTYHDDYWVSNFYHERLDDNFIVHNYVDYKKLSSSLPVADSWQTEAYGDSLTIEEA